MALANGSGLLFSVMVSHTPSPPESYPTQRLAQLVRWFCCIQRRNLFIKKKKACQGSPFKEFGWVILQPGPGHIAMNMLHSFFDMTWDVFMKDIAYLINFQSEKAQIAAKKVTDHHKGWTLLTVAREAIVDELITSYIRHKLSLPSAAPEETVVCNPRDFVTFVRTSKNPNICLWRIASWKCLKQFSCIVQEQGMGIFH
jgi:hypothetical protein